ncbi:PPD7 [Symbiodinium necroappetens]|uniref:PPD7 protein n=1 Tax=Symbiodinium necroappetens TaxID=1628268 RepID=A0A812KD06_9DINO|nr:PPD7 [Symbiodinium necroappetens]
MASQSCAFCALSPSLSPSPLPTPSQALGSTTKPPAPKWQRWVLGFGLGIRNLRPCSRGYRAIRARSSEHPEGSDSAPPAAGIPKGSEQKRGKAPRNRWLNLLERLFRDLGEVSSRPRRDATYWGLVLGSLSLAVVSDFLGIMRLLLSLNPSGARQMALDEVYPVEGLKTYRQRGRYRLRYPGEWLFDQSVAFSKQAAIELPTLRQKKRIVPDAAFGPAGGGLATTATAQNLSVVVQPVKAQRLEDLMGEPEEAFRKFAAETFAAEGSGRTAQLLGAERSARGSYELEYVVTYPDQEGTVDVHCWSVVALASSTPFSALYTMTLVSPERMLTQATRDLFRESWHSFELEAA